MKKVKRLKTYIVEIAETVVYEVEVEAKSEQEASDSVLNGEVDYAILDNEVGTDAVINSISLK